MGFLTRLGLPASIATMDDEFPRLYAQLRALAREQMRGERAEHTLQPTALVHEALLRLGLTRAASDAERARLFRAAAEEMRRILVDHARSRGRIKHGGAHVRIALVDAEPAFEVDPAQFLALDEALRRLEAEDARAAEVVHLRFFTGLDIAETARVLGCAERTVAREWSYARAWLLRELRGTRPDGAS